MSKSIFELSREELELHIVELTKIIEMQADNLETMARYVLTVLRERAKEENDNN